MTVARSISILYPLYVEFQIRRCKTLISLLSNNTNFNSKFSIKNSLELLNNSKDVHVPKNAVLHSFDIKKSVSEPSSS